MKDITHELTGGTLTDISIGTEGWSGAEIQVCLSFNLLLMKYDRVCVGKRVEFSPSIPFSSFSNDTCS